MVTSRFTWSGATRPAAFGSAGIGVAAPKCRFRACPGVDPELPVFMDLHHTVEMRQTPVRCWPPPMSPIPNASDILQAVIDATPDAIFVKDVDGRYVLLNQAAAKFVGRSPAELVGKSDLEIYPEETARRFIEDDKA